MAERSGDGLEAYPEIGLRKTLKGVLFTSRGRVPQECRCGREGAQQVGCSKTE